MTQRVHIQNLQHEVELDLPALEALAVYTLDRLELEGEISLSFLLEEEIVRLNAQFFGKEAPTDVMAFPLEAGEVPGDDLVGEVLVCPAQGTRQAAELGIDSAEEMMRLVAHGILHLAGRTDESDEKRTAMIAEGDALLTGFLQENH